MIIVVDSQGKYTGTSYFSFLEATVTHHAQYNEHVVDIATPLTEDEEKGLVAVSGWQALITTSKLSKLNRQLSECICCEYDFGTQISFIAKYVTETDETVKQQLLLVFAWIMTVLGYYYTVKAQIEAGQTPVVDFTQFAATKPDVSLRSFFEA
jgi:hypothetical protein